jgi:hypothetical protein
VAALYRMRIDERALPLLRNFVVEGAGEEYDAPEIEPNWKSLLNHKGSRNSFPATMRKTQEVERLCGPDTPLSSFVFRKGAKLDDSRLVGVRLKAKPHEALSQSREEPFYSMSPRVCFFPSFSILDPKVEWGGSRRGSLYLQRMKLSFTTPCRFNRRTEKP